MTEITIRAILLPTENPDKVKKAITNLFGEVKIKETETELSTTLNEIKLLSPFRSRIAQDRIRTTLSTVFKRWHKEGILSFGLNRQAAYAGHVSLNLENEDPMGPIQVIIKGEIDEIINYLCS